jgi:hypothetical protein
MSRKTIAKQANSKGTVFALLSGPSGFEVWKLAENYCGQVRGGITRSWRYVEKNMTEEKARTLFNRRVAA